MYYEPGGLKLPTASMADRKVAHASKGHCTAFAVLGDDEGYRVQAESHLELCNLLVLNARSDVKCLKEQALFNWDDDGQARCHYFDVLAFLKSGDRIAYTVKPAVRAASDRFLREMQTIAGQALKQRFCEEVRLVTEKDINKIEYRNAAIYAAVRDPDPEAEAVAMATIAVLTGSATLRDLSIKTGMGARGYRALIRLIRTRHLEQVSHELISPNVHVRPSGDKK